MYTGNVSEPLLHSNQIKPHVEQKHVSVGFYTNPSTGTPQWSGKSEWASGQRGCGWGRQGDCLQMTESG